MKYLLVLLVVVAALAWLAIGRRRDAGHDDPDRGPAGAEPPKRVPPPATMLACAHCGVHLPAAEAVHDAAGRAYCGEAHRLAGPREPRQPG